MWKLQKFASSCPPPTPSDDDSDDSKGLLYYDCVATDGSAIQLGEHTFHAWWLWANDAESIHPSSGQRTRSIGRFPGWNIKDVKTVSILAHPPPAPGSFHSNGTVYKIGPGEQKDSEDLPRTLLQIEWDVPKDEYEDSIFSYFDIDWLLSCSYHPQVQADRYEKSRVTKSKSIGSSGNAHCSQMIKFDYRDLINANDENGSMSDDSVFHILDGIMDRGAVMLTNVPSPIENEDNSSPVARIGRDLTGGAPLSHGSLYGDTFHVRSSLDDAKNIAYTSVALPPHQDLVYYESKPFLQLLHCVQNSSDGGASTLVDAMAAAEELRDLDSDLFEVLTRCPATFAKQRPGADMCRVQPHIVTDRGGAVTAVHWSPPFEGPPLCIPMGDMEAYRIAYAALESMLDDSMPAAAGLESHFRDYARGHTWEYHMQPGEMIIFNNQRMVHGRRSFRATGERHLMGCYTNADETVSNYRVLLRNRMPHQPKTILNTGRGSIEVP